MTLQIALATGAAIDAHFEALARLRCSVFREYPYLYDGSLEYERAYLASYARSPDSLAVLAMDGERIVGASTAMPLAAHSDEVVPPLVAAGYAPDTVYYFGESVLEPGYRGHGLGSAFFVERERRARELGFRVAAFCAVDRPADHPRRPPGYVAPGALWRRHGFVRRPDVVGEFSWQDVGDAAETVKPMVFWIKELT